jgi:hypothetical protein
MVLTLPESKRDNETDEEFSSRAQDFNPAEDFLNRYTEESTDPTKTDFSVEAYEGEKGRGFFSPDGQEGKPGEVAAYYGGEKQRQRDLLNKEIDAFGAQFPIRTTDTPADRPRGRGMGDTWEGPQSSSPRPPTYTSRGEETSLARDRPAVRPTGQRSASDSRPNFRSTGRSFVGNYSRSLRTGSGVSGNTSFSSASSANPNQTWGGYRSPNVAATTETTNQIASDSGTVNQFGEVVPSLGAEDGDNVAFGLGVTNQPATVDLNKSEVAGGKTLYGDTDYGLQEDGTLGVGDDDWGSDVDINELENLIPGLELAQAGPGEKFLDDYVSPQQPYDEQIPVGNYIKNEDTGEVNQLADSPIPGELPSDNPQLAQQAKPFATVPSTSSWDPGSDPGVIASDRAVADAESSWKAASNNQNNYLGGRTAGTEAEYNEYMRLAAISDAASKRLDAAYEQQARAMQMYTSSRS